MTQSQGRVISRNRWHKHRNSQKSVGPKWWWKSRTQVVPSRSVIHQLKYPLSSLSEDPRAIHRLLLKHQSLDTRNKLKFVSHRPRYNFHDYYFVNNLGLWIKLWNSMVGQIQRCSEGVAPRLVFEGELLIGQGFRLITLLFPSNFNVFIYCTF